MQIKELNSNLISLSHSQKSFAGATQEKSESTGTKGSKGASRRKFMAQAGLTAKPTLSDAQLATELQQLNAGTISIQTFLNDIGGVANLNKLTIVDSQGEPNSLLAYAAEQNLPDAAQALLSAGFNVNNIENNQFTTLSIIMNAAATPNANSKQWEQIALSMINNPNMKLSTLNPTTPATAAINATINGDNALQYAVAYANTFGQTDLIAALAAKGVPLNEGFASLLTNGQGGAQWVVQTTPLFQAIQAGNVILTEYLMGKDPSAPLPQGAVPASTTVPVTIGNTTYSSALQYLEANKDTIIAENRGSDKTYNELLNLLS